MAFEIILANAAEKNLDRIQRPTRIRILDALEDLRANPRPRGCVKLEGAEDLWRIRVGSYRVVYTIHDDELIVLVVRIAHRKNVYRG